MVVVIINGVDVVFSNSKDSINNSGNIKIILVGTSHTGNMGSAARAMKTMGLTQLCLVNPTSQPDEQAISLAAGASDIIEHATVFPSLEEAIADCTLVIGTSARVRHLAWPTLTPHECGEKIAQSAMTTPAPVALIFGCERVGLTNEELQKCHYHVTIPANPDYSSLNLAMSVQILCYEIRMALLNLQSSEKEIVAPAPLPKEGDIERFYHHLEQTLLQTGFIHPNHPGQIMSRLRRLFTRAHIEQQELNILRGILTSINQTVTKE